MNSKQRRTKAHLFRRPEELPPIEIISKTVEVCNLVAVRGNTHQSTYTRPTNGFRKIPMSLPRVKWLERKDA